MKSFLLWVLVPAKRKTMILFLSTKKLARVRIHTMMKVFYDLEKALLQLVKESLSLSPDALVAMIVSPKTNKHYRNSKSDTPAFVLKRLKRKYIIETIDGFLNL